MKKTLIFIGIFILLVGSVSAFKIDLFGYRIQYNEKPKVIDMTQEVELEDFEEDIRLLNSIKEVQLVLKELDYRRIGFINKDDNSQFTFFINEEGKITKVSEGLLEPDVILKGSLSKIKKSAEQGNYAAIKKQVDVPFKVKFKLMIMKIF